jgi:hypothetical protein
MLEIRKDYVNSFRLNKMDINLRKDIFGWIDKTLNKLSKEGQDMIVIDLKNDFIRSFKELREIDIEAC